MMKWENSECLEDDCSGLSVFCLVVFKFGEPFKEIQEGFHRLKKKENRKNTTKPSLTVKLKYSWALLCLFHLPYHIIRERKNFNGYSKDQPRKPI